MGCEFVGLPLVNPVVGLQPLGAGDERGVGRRDVENRVLEIFRVAYRLIGLKRACWNGYISLFP